MWLRKRILSPPFGQHSHKAACVAPLVLLVALGLDLGLVLSVVQVLRRLVLVAQVLELKLEQVLVAALVLRGKLVLVLVLVLDL